MAARVFSDPRTCMYPSCATWEVVGGSYAGLFLCRSNSDAPLGLCDGEDEFVRFLHLHLMFVGDEYTPWPGKEGEFYVEDNTCDSLEEEQACYLSQSNIAGGIAFREWNSLSACAFQATCSLFRFEVERVTVLNSMEASYRLRSNASSVSYIGVGKSDSATAMVGLEGASSVQWTELRLLDTPASALLFRSECGRCPSASGIAAWLGGYILVTLLVALVPSLRAAYATRRGNKRGGNHAAAASPSSNPADGSGGASALSYRTTSHAPQEGWPERAPDRLSDVIFQLAWAAFIIAVSIRLLYTLSHDVAPWLSSLAFAMGYTQDMVLLVLLFAIRPTDKEHLDAALWLIVIMTALEAWTGTWALKHVTSTAVVQTWTPFTRIAGIGKIAALGTAQVIYLAQLLVLFGLLATRCRAQMPDASLYRYLFLMCRSTFAAFATIHLVSSVAVYLVSTADSAPPSTDAEREALAVATVSLLCRFVLPIYLFVGLTHPRLRALFHLRALHFRPASATATGAAPGGGVAERAYRGIFLPLAPFKAAAPAEAARARPCALAPPQSAEANAAVVGTGDEVFKGEWDEVLDLSRWESADPRFHSLALTWFLGRGGFAEVFVGNPRRMVTEAEAEAPDQASADNQALEAADQVAVKVFKARAFLNHKRERVIRTLENELGVLMHANHPNVVRFLSTAVVYLPFDTNGGRGRRAAGSGGSSGGGSPATRLFPHPALVMELCQGGTLDELLHTRCASSPPLTPVAQLSLALDVAVGVSYLHAQGWMHRDLKPANVLLDGSRPIPRAKVSDVGLATRIGMEQSSRAGSFRYMAPEVYFLSYTHRADAYSYGILLWEVLECKRPWGALSDLEVTTAVTMTHTRPPLSRSPPSLGTHDPAGGFVHGMQSLVTACWAQDPASRPSFASIVQRLQGLSDAANQAPAVDAAPPVSAASVQLDLEGGSMLSERAGDMCSAPSDDDAFPLWASKLGLECSAFTHPVDTRDRAPLQQPSAPAPVQPQPAPSPPADANPATAPDTAPGGNGADSGGDDADTLGGADPEEIELLGSTGPGFDGLVEEYLRSFPLAGSMLDAAALKFTVAHLLMHQAQRPLATDPARLAALLFVLLVQVKQPPWIQPVPLDRTEPTPSSSPPCLTLIPPPCPTPMPHPHAGTPHGRARRDPWIGSGRAIRLAAGPRAAAWHRPRRLRRRARTGRPRRRRALARAAWHRCDGRALAFGGAAG